MAEAVEKLGWQVAAGFARFIFARAGWLQTPSFRLYAPSG
ncbi:MAG: hypothetical protein ACI9JL_004455, partial [Paracoccaceae bacterium]